MTRIRTTLALAMGFSLILACASGQSRDGTRVSSDSNEFKAVTRAIQEPCANPAEFGRCGCYMDGLQTSCSIVKACLDAGFCKVVRQ